MKILHTKGRFGLFSLIALAALSAGAMTASCNRDDYLLEPPSESVLPVIKIDSETGVYNIKTGKELVIAPTFENAGNALFEWKENDEVLSRDRTLRMIWNEAGSHYITLTVSNSSGTASEEIRVDVDDLLIPHISLPVPAEGISIQTGTPFAITPEIAHAETDGFDICWKVNGEIKGREKTFRFQSETPGSFSIEVTASTPDGSDSRTFVVKVLDTLPYELSFPGVSYFNSSTERFTFPCRGVLLTPVMKHLSGSSFSWSVNGTVNDCNGRSFFFTPDAPGEYIVNVTVDRTASAGVKVVCVDATEDSRFRKAGASHSARSCEVY